MASQPLTSRSWTYLGLVIALLGIPIVSILFKLLGFTRGDSVAVIVRELAVLGLVALLLWIIRSRERLPLSSIGLRRTRTGATILSILAVMLAFGAILSLCLALLLPALGLSYGSGGGPAVSTGITLLVVIRAGIAEEIFYRGFAIERLQALTGSKILAASLSLIMFAGFHFSQGIAGIIIAFLVGAVATGYYLWKRNLVVLIAAHFLLDFIPNVLIPLVSGD